MTDLTCRPESWRAIPGYEGRYEVSDMGRVRNRTGRILKPTFHPYPQLGLSKNGERQTWRIHILVLAAFAGPCPPDQVARHLNDIKTDNRWPENLAYGTWGDNARDAVHNGSHPMANKTACPEGHPLSGDNLIESRRGDGRTFRQCKTCIRRQQAQWARDRRQRLRMAA